MKLIVLTKLSSSLLQAKIPFLPFITYSISSKIIIGFNLAKLSEITLGFSGVNINNMIIYFLIPTTLFLIIYIYIFFNNKNLGRK